MATPLKVLVTINDDHHTRRRVTFTGETRELLQAIQLKFNIEADDWKSSICQILDNEYNVYRQLEEDDSITDGQQFNIVFPTAGKHSVLILHLCEHPSIHPSIHPIPSNPIPSHPIHQNQRKDLLIDVMKALLRD